MIWVTKEAFQNDETKILAFMLDHIEKLEGVSCFRNYSGIQIFKKNEYPAGNLCLQPQCQCNVPGASPPEASDPDRGGESALRTEPGVSFIRHEKIPRSRGCDRRDPGFKSGI